MNSPASTTNPVSEPVRLMSSDQMRRSINRIAHEILEKNGGVEKLALVGIRTRGETLTNRLAQKILEIEGVSVPVGVVDITLYRDDLSNITEQPFVRGTSLPFDVDRSRIVLVDDVLFTGRTIRAAIDAIIDFGRPKFVQLAVLIDRGHREFPFRADFVGKNISTARSQIVKVKMAEVDGEDQVLLINREPVTTAK